MSLDTLSLDQRYENALFHELKNFLKETIPIPIYALSSIQNTYPFLSISIECQPPWRFQSIVSAEIILWHTDEHKQLESYLRNQLPLAFQRASFLKDEGLKALSVFRQESKIMKSQKGLVQVSWIYKGLTRFFENE